MGLRPGTQRFHGPELREETSVALVLRQEQILASARGG